ncbi:MAG: hypothetical protein FJ144_01430 [Deltaproteobacteria bacterium]|nr:hypothetical protein [Deltaproteobacteria bacterium]
MPRLEPASRPPAPHERAFGRDRALCDGVLDGHPYRAILTTLQVKTRLDLRATRKLSNPETP